MNDDLQIYFGDAVKALDDKGRVGGYLVKFSDGKAGGKDFHGEFFDVKGYYGPSDGDGAECLLEHGFPLGKDEVSKTLADRTFQPIKTRRDELGIFAETFLNIEDEYEKFLFQRVQKGKVGWSSGAPGHRVKIDADGRITRWPIAEGSLTPRPANPQSRAIALKSYHAECATANVTWSIEGAPAAKGLFERELSNQKHSTLDLWTTFYKCVGEIAKAATTADITGVPVDTSGLVAEATAGFLKSLSPIITAQIDDYLARPAEEPFYLKGAQDVRLKALLTDSDVAFRDSLPDHSKAVASAVEEFAALSTALASSVKEYAGRTERKSAFRLKEGRMLSKVNLDQMDAACGRLKDATGNLSAIHDDLTGLIEKARAPKADEVKAADAKVLELRTKWLRIEAARHGVEVAA